MIRIVLPHHLRTLVQVNKEIELQVDGPITLESVLDALETQFPVLRGTIRDHATQQRRPFIRFFACGQDWSQQPTNILLPAPVVMGTQPIRIVGAMAGG